MAVYSYLLFNGSINTNGFLVYTVPAGVTAVIRDMELLNPIAATLDFSVYITPSGGSSSTIWKVNALASATWSQWNGRVVLPTSGSVFCNVASGQQAQFTMSGYQLSLP